MIVTIITGHTPSSPYLDIDECLSNTLNDCHEGAATCINTRGDYYCACNEGYTGDGTNCTGTNVVYHCVMYICTKRFYHYTMHCIYPKVLPCILTT